MLDAEFIVKNIIPIVTTIVGLSALVLSFWFNKQSLKQKNSDDERKEIYKKLNDFYGPFQQLRKKSQLLYDQFAKEEKDKHKAHGERFKTLLFLLEGNKFTGNDENLLTEIITINKQLEDIIINRAGLIDDEELRNKIFPKFITHAFIIRLAKEGTLSGNNENFINLTFPSEIDEKIEAK
jgi:hypothetical protein